MGLHVSQLLEGFSSLPIGVAQLGLHLIEISLHLLPDSHGVILAAYLSLQARLHGLHNTLVVAFVQLELVILLSQPAINLTLDLSELQLDAENFGFFMLQRSLENRLRFFFKCTKENLIARNR